MVVGVRGGGIDDQQGERRDETYAERIVAGREEPYHDLKGYQHHDEGGAARVQ